MIYIGIIGAVFLIDFFLKKYVDQKYARKVQHPRLNNKVIIEKFYNEGATLNLLAKRPKWMKAIHTGVMVVLVVIYAILLGKPGREKAKVGMAFVLGGGMSNLYDRYTKKHVVDYVRFNFGPKWLQRIIFNVSDFFIFIGAIFAVLAGEEG